MIYYIFQSNIHLHNPTGFKYVIFLLETIPPTTKTIQYTGHTINIQSHSPQNFFFPHKNSVFFFCFFFFFQHEIPLFNWTVYISKFYWKTVENFSIQKNIFWKKKAKKKNFSNHSFPKHGLLVKEFFFFLLPSI